MAMSAVALLLLPCGLTAQIDTGSLTGTVKDPSGAVISGAKITLTNDGTRMSVATTSTATGNYVFSGLLPGTYTLQAKESGFEDYVVHGIEVHVQQVLTVDLPMVTGSVRSR